MALEASPGGLFHLNFTNKWLQAQPALRARGSHDVAPLQSVAEALALQLAVLLGSAVLDEEFSSCSCTCSSNWRSEDALRSIVFGIRKPVEDTVAAMLRGMPFVAPGQSPWPEILHMLQTARQGWAC